MLSLRQVGTYCRRLSSPSPSGHSMARGRRSISDVSQIRRTGLMSATLTSNRYAGNMHRDVHRANIAGALVLAREADTLLATSREQQNTAWRAISEAWKASWTEPHRRTNSGCLSVVHDPITRRVIQPTDHGRGGLCLSNAELRLRWESRVDSVVAHTVTQISNRSVNPANEEFS